MVSNSGTSVRYRIVQTIGRGGMGEVCLADDLLLQRQVALKFLTSADTSEALNHLLGEARSVAALDHPFICSIYEVNTVDERPCIVMEYVRGETLERRLRRGPLGLAEGLHVAEEIAEAVEAAHRRRVVHGDLKPANVMLTEDRHVKVMDFGLARRLVNADVLDEGITMAMAPSDTATVRGTPAYMAPELIRGEMADQRSDMFAFGVLLYELLTGSNPFRRGGIQATIAAIIGGSLVPLQDRTATIPPALSAAIPRMLARDPGARYRSFAEVRSDLRRIAIDSSSTVGPAVWVKEDRPDDAAPRLIGRASERAQLLESLNLAASSRGSLVLLTGEAGVGKTRLADEALDTARRHGYQVLVGRCSEQDAASPLIPYIELIEQASQFLPATALRDAIGPSAPELSRLAPELLRLFPDMPAPLDLTPQLRQRLLFANIREFLTRIGRITPLVVFIDDLQWADDSTLHLTQHIAQHLATLPILMILGYRDTDGADEGSEAHATTTVKLAFDDLVRRRQARVIAVRPFAESELRAMLTVLAQQPPPGRLVRQFAEQTGGNPLFVEELFRHLRDEGALFQADRIWKRDLDLHHVAIPESLRAIVDRRLRRISTGTLRVLKAAAVIGLQFDLDVLEAVAEVDADALFAAVEESEEARLVKGPSGRQETLWRFTHQLIRHTLGAAVPNLRRQRLHLRIADAMARLAESRPASIADMAHHLYRAGRLAPATRTATALIAAGDAAREMYAVEEAVQHYRRALEVLQDGCEDTAMRVRVEEQLADALALLGERAAAMEHYKRVSTAHQAAHAIIEGARIARKMAALQWQGGERTQAMASYQRALDSIANSDAPLEAAHLYHELGLAAFRSGDNRGAIDWSERALRAAEAALAAPAITSRERKLATAATAHATNTIGVALARSGHLEAARERIEQSLALAREQGLLDVACRGYANLGVLYSTIAPKRAIDLSLTGLEMASRIGAAALQSHLYANLAAAYCALTDRCETEGKQAAEAAISLDRELGQMDHLAVPLIVLAQIHQCHGDLEAAQQAYTEALTLALQIGEPQLLLPCYDGLATVCLDRGDRSVAETYLLKARDLCERTGLDPEAVLLLPFLC